MFYAKSGGAKSCWTIAGKSDHVGTANRTHHPSGATQGE